MACLLVHGDRYLWQKCHVLFFNILELSLPLIPNHVTSWGKNIIGIKCLFVFAMEVNSASRLQQSCLSNTLQTFTSCDSTRVILLWMPIRTSTKVMQIFTKVFYLFLSVMNNKVSNNLIKSSGIKLVSSVVSIPSLHQTRQGL